MSSPTKKTQKKLGIVQTAQQLRAFDDYFQMGFGRSVRRLYEKYMADLAAGTAPPCRTERQLERWCSVFNWVDGCAKREAEDIAEQRHKTQQRTGRVRDRILRALEIDASAFAQTIFANVGEDGAVGAPVIIRDAASLEKMMALFFKMGEEPLAERREITGVKDGPPIGVSWLDAVRGVEEDGDADDSEGDEDE